MKVCTENRLGEFEIFYNELQLFHDQTFPCKTMVNQRGIFHLHLLNLQNGIV